MFTAIIAPISFRWASQLDQEQKKSITKLLSWRIFLFLHWTILIPTFVRNGTVIVHIASLLYRGSVITWLILLVAYSKVPQPQEEQGIPDHKRCELAMCPHTVPIHLQTSSELALIFCHLPTTSPKPPEVQGIPESSELVVCPHTVPQYLKESYNHPATPPWPREELVT